MRKTLICMLALLMLLSSVLVACGGGDSGAENKPNKNPNGNSDEFLDCEHEIVVDAAVEATCTTAGKTEGKHCAKCGEILVEQEVILARHIVVDGKCTQCGMKISVGLEYSLNDDYKSYSVAGIGSCTDTDIVIPPTDPDDGMPVTSIEKKAFKGCKELTSITIPDSVTSIEDEAFYNCEGLKSVTIGNGVTSIGNDAFYKCEGLTSVTIPDSVTSIGSNAFTGCTRLTSVTVPDSVTSIGTGVFKDTAYYNDYSNWENDVLYIGNHLIKAKDSLSGYSIKEGTVCIADSAFNNFKVLKSVTIPDSVISIGDSAFSWCAGLTSVTIGNGVTSIGDHAFSSSGLTSVTIGNGVISIGDLAFASCEKLTSVTIPDSVTSIASRAFNGCSELTSVDIGNGITSIGWEAFAGCPRLTTITYKGTMEQWKETTSKTSWYYSSIGGKTGDFTVYCTDGEIKYE